MSVTHCTMHLFSVLVYCDWRAGLVLHIVHVQCIYLLCVSVL